MADQIVWLHGTATVPGIVEKICPGRHVRQNQWQSVWNEEYVTPRSQCRYDYISDYECIFNHPIDDLYNNYMYSVYQQRWQNLQAAKIQGTSVPIANLAHFTNPAAAQHIVNTQGFRGEQKKINEYAGHDVKANLSWWSPIFTAHDIIQVRNYLGGTIQPFLNDNEITLKNQFAQSDAFLPNPRRYGGYLFQYGINELCEYYSRQVGGEVQYKILGTFGYKQEVMHAVLVCSRANGIGQFAAYPEVPTEDVFNEAVITRDIWGNWVWKPQATATEIFRLQAHLQGYPIYRRWENVAFAFHIPDNVIPDNVMMMAGNTAGHQKIIDQQGNIIDVPLPSSRSLVTGYRLL